MQTFEHLLLLKDSLALYMKNNKITQLKYLSYYKLCVVNNLD